MGKNVQMFTPSMGQLGVNIEPMISKWSPAWCCREGRVGFGCRG